MNLDNLIRDYARQDLQRFCPTAHYWLRDHDPIADRELTEPLLGEPVKFGLTPRERVAATALGDLATYEIRSREIWDAANPARDCVGPPPATGTPFDQEREVWGRYECFRSSALVYVRMLGEAQLIEQYQTPSPAPTTGSATSAPAMPVGAPFDLPDPARRLALLRELGGDAKYRRGKWIFSAITKLVKSEKTEGRKRFAEKTVRADLREAAENEREAKRTGVFESGLGTR